jgi:CheY-like chemotaxis protein
MKGLTVLLAEDNEEYRNHLAVHLRSSGLEVIEAKDGQQALDFVLGDLSFDILVTDYQMPRLNGIDLVKHLRALGYRQPMIVWTAMTPTPVCREADAVIRKHDGLSAVTSEIGAMPCFVLVFSA